MFLDFFYVRESQKEALKKLLNALWLFYSIAAGLR
jgi:hypothetical protein